MQTQQLINGTANPLLQLDILEAAKANKSGKLAQMTLDYEASRAESALVDRFPELLDGGDAMVGESIFRTSYTAQCIRCHKLGQVGGDVGPSLNGVASRLDERAMLESLIDPQAKIADGYGLTTFTMKNGEIFTGSIEKKSANFFSIKDQSGARILIKTADIKSSSKSVSAMPPMMGILAPRDLRDLVAFMKTLK